ncbi:MAG TPA: RNA helicase, partial [Methylococcaceae bacterium]|nr:RNA helicase [Methylococcaceae bacterium]
ASGKAASSKNKKAEPKKKESKIKDRHRDRKSIGKRRKPSELKTNG